MWWIALALALQTSTPYPREMAASDRAAVSREVGQLLKDSESARYRWPKQVAFGSYCGWVNAKNSYGAYVGFRQFYVIGGVGGKTGKFSTFGATLATDDLADSDTQIVRKLCRENGYSTSAPPAE